MHLKTTDACIHFLKHVSSKLSSKDLVEKNSNSLNQFRNSQTLIDPEKETSLKVNLSQNREADHFLLAAELPLNVTNSELKSLSKDIQVVFNNKELVKKMCHFYFHCIFSIFVNKL